MTTTRNLGRLSEIAQVAVRHGFGYFFERHKLTDLLPWGERVPDLEERSARGVRLRELLDELGPTFVKFGQLPSTRPDVVPPDIIAERSGVDRSSAPRGASQRRSCRGQGAAARRAAPDRGRPRAALPGRTSDQG